MSVTRTYDVPGISCGHCQAAIEEEVSDLDGVETVQVDVDARRVTVVGEFDDDAVHTAVEEAGYEVASAS